MRLDQWLCKALLVRSALLGKRGNSALSYLYQYIGVIIDTTWMKFLLVPKCAADSACTVVLWLLKEED